MDCLVPPYDNITYGFFYYYVYLDLEFIVRFLFLLKLIIVKLLWSSKSIIVAVIFYQLLSSNSYCYIFNFLLILVLSGNIELNPGPNNISSKFRVLYLNIRGLYNNISELQIVSRKYDIILYSQSLVSSRRHVSTWFQ